MYVRTSCASVVCAVGGSLAGVEVDGGGGKLVMAGGGIEGGGGSDGVLEMDGVVDELDGIVDGVMDGVVAASPPLAQF